MEKNVRKANTIKPKKKLNKNREIWRESPLENEPGKFGIVEGQLSRKEHEFTLKRPRKCDRKRLSRKEKNVWIILKPIEFSKGNRPGRYMLISSDGCLLPFLKSSTESAEICGYKGWVKLKLYWIFSFSCNSEN